MILFFSSIFIFCFACNYWKNEAKAKDSTNILMSTDVSKKNINYADTNLSFMAENYLKISNIYSGPVFEDDKTGNSVFFRILEIPEEEHLLLHAEKISVGEEGGNYQLLYRYHIEEKKLSLNEFSLSKIDSLVFLDSITISGYFNEKKISFNLHNQKAALH